MSSINAEKKRSVRKTFLDFLVEIRGSKHFETLLLFNWALWVKVKRLMELTKIIHQHFFGFLYFSKQIEYSKLSTREQFLTGDIRNR